MSTLINLSRQHLGDNSVFVDANASKFKNSVSIGGDLPDWLPRRIYDTRQPIQQRVLRDGSSLVDASEGYRNEISTPGASIESIRQERVRLFQASQYKQSEMVRLQMDLSQPQLHSIVQRGAFTGRRF